MPSSDKIAKQCQDVSERFRNADMAEFQRAINIVTFGFSDLKIESNWQFLIKSD